MLTLKLKIKNTDNNELMCDYINSYSHIFYKLYNNAELIEDSTFLKSLQNNHICSYTINCLKVDVKMKLNQHLTFEKKKIKQLQDLRNRIENEDFIGKNKRRNKFKIFQKISYLENTIGKNICFGRKDLLRKITKLKQEIQFKNLDEQTKIKKQILVDRILTEYRTNRKIPFYIVGEQMKKGGNRKINFDLNNQKIVFKPNVKTKIELEFYCGRNQKHLLNQIQESSNNSTQPLTVSISNEYIYLTYDESKLNGTSFCLKSLKEEQKNVISKESKKELFKIHIREHEKQLMSNKLEHRIASIDLNPNFIGFSIVDYEKNSLFKENHEKNNQKVIFTKCYNFTELNKKNGKSSNNNSKQVNKRNFEIIEVYKNIFELCKNFKVSKFAIEDLDFKSKIEFASKEANRQTKNIWNRGLQMNQIIKRTNSLGIKLIKVNPVYSTFIGNLIYDFYDPISSSIEIGRRAFYKYQKSNNLFDSLNRINQERLNHLLGENMSYKNWKDLYSKISKLDYRNKLIKKSFSFKNRKSKVLIIS